MDVHPADLFSDGRARIVGEVSDNDVSSFEREPDGTRAADAAGRARDDGYLAFEPSRHGLSPIVGGEEDRSDDQLPVATNTFFSSVNASRASGPSSRPIPERLKPPNGVQ